MRNREIINSQRTAFRIAESQNSWCRPVKLESTCPACSKTMVVDIIGVSSLIWNEKHEGFTNGEKVQGVFRTYKISPQKSITDLRNFVTCSLLWYDNGTQSTPKDSLPRISNLMILRRSAVTRCRSSGKEMKRRIYRNLNEFWNIENEWDIKKWLCFFTYEPRCILH